VPPPLKAVAQLGWASPPRFAAMAAKVLPWLWAAALLLLAAGLYVGWVIAPTDAVQRESYRILYIHVPAAWMAMLIYVVMAFWAVWGWMLNARMASIYARALAPTGALMTLLSLVTGSLWGLPTWGTWWVWDARLTTQFILLLLFLGYIGLTASIDDFRRGSHAGALLALVGVVNVPLIYFSVRWWNTLHQGASITTQGTSIATPMLAGLLLMTLGFWAYVFAVVFGRARAMVLELAREEDTAR
jgi:heme exporter protein C